MLHALGAHRIALLSNNPDKAVQLERYGVEVTERMPTRVHLSAANARYLSPRSGTRRTRSSCRLPSREAAGG